MLSVGLRKGLLVFVVLAMLAALTSVSPVAGLNEDETVAAAGSGSLQADRPVGEPLSDIADLQEAPVVGTAAGPGAVRVDVDPAPVAVSSEAGRPGWVASLPEESRVQVGRPSKVGGSPVTVEIAANAANRRSEASARVRVLEVELSEQLSPFSSVVALDWVNPDGLEVSPRGGFTLSFDLTDVNLGPLADVGERLTISAFRDCELFDADPADLDVDVEDEIDVKALAPEVVCGGIEKLDAVFDANTRVLSVQVDEAAIDQRIAQRRSDLVKEGAAAEDIDPKRGRVLAIGDRSFGLELGRAGLVEDGLVRSQSTDAPSPDAVEGTGVDAGDPAPLSLSFQAGGGGGSGLYGVSSGSSSSAGDYSAQPVPTLTDAQVGLFSGSAESSYPIPVPAPAAGPSPSVSLSYSSASVDGMTMNTNNQAGLIGVGWSLASGGFDQSDDEDVRPARCCVG